MHRSLKIAVVASLLLVPAFALAAEGTFERKLDVHGTVMLTVETGSGYIHLTAGTDSEVHVVGYVHAGDNRVFGWSSQESGTPEERVKRVVDNPPVQQVGDSVRVGKQPHYQNVRIDYVITAPRGSQVELTSGSGEIRAYGVGSSFKAETGSGTIDASGIGGYVSLEAGSGDIHAELVNGHDVKAETGSGNIRLRGVQGGLNAETGSGDVEVSGEPSARWKVETGSGSITLTTGKAHFSLDAETGSGSIHTDPPLTTRGPQEHHHVIGDIHGGGSDVHLETGSGSITIHE